MHESRSSQNLLQTAVAIARRWRVVVPFALVTPIVAYIVAASEPAVYQSSAEVLSSRQGFVISGLDESSYSEQTRSLKTEVEIARLPDVAARVAPAAGLEDRGWLGVLAQTTVAADGTTDLLTFTAYDRERAVAERLATAYAEGYIAYRRVLDTQTLQRARDVVDVELERAYDQGRPAPAQLVEKQKQLTFALATLSTNATLAQPGTEPVGVEPRPLRAAAQAAILGLVLGIGCAWLASLLDPRARTADEISTQLGIPLLAAIPLEPPRAQDGNVLPPASADALDLLRASIDQSGRERGGTGRVLMVATVSRVEGDSTLAANLAVAFARSGQSVALVDCDLRRSRVADFFGIPVRPGVVDAVKGTSAIDDVVQNVKPESVNLSTTTDENGTPGRLTVVPAGAGLTMESGQLFARGAFAEVVYHLARQADVVLLDGPALVDSSDALTLTGHADRVLVVASLSRYRRSHADRVRRLLAVTPRADHALVVVGTPSELARGAPSKLRRSRSSSPMPATRSL